MFSINLNVMGMVEGLIEKADQLGCRYYQMECGTHVIDMGVKRPGGFEAARIFTDINMAGLGKCQLVNFELGDGYSVPAVEVYIDNPFLACLVSQIAGWPLSRGEFSALGSGPARALAAVGEDPSFKITAFRDESNTAVLGVQSVELPSDELAISIADACSVAPEKLYMLVHKTASLVASVQVSARICEQTLNELIQQGFDIDTIQFARGICLVAPPVSDELEAMARANDCLFYGGGSDYWVRAKDEEILAVIHKLVTNPERGSFGDVFLGADKDFYNIALDVHSPARVQIFNMDTGNVFRAGEINIGHMKKTLFNNIP